MRACRNGRRTQVRRKVRWSHLVWACRTTPIRGCKVRSVSHLTWRGTVTLHRGHGLPLHTVIRVAHITADLIAPQGVATNRIVCIDAPIRFRFVVAVTYREAAVAASRAGHCPSSSLGLPWQVKRHCPVNWSWKLGFAGDMRRSVWPFDDLILSSRSRNRRNASSFKPAKRSCGGRSVAIPAPAPNRAI